MTIAEMEALYKRCYRIIDNFDSLVLVPYFKNARSVGIRRKDPIMQRKWVHIIGVLVY